MSDSFFGFDTDFASGAKHVLGRPGLDDELLTADVEDEYDALNDETFGRAANDDWEEAHEKLSELIKSNNLGIRSVFNDSVLENDVSQDEIVSKSISQLGLEDDLDDPAIMTVSRNCHSSIHRGSAFGPSPPPPAILETEVCGSPKTHSIWSTTPKDSGISSLLHSLSHNSSSLSHQESCPPLNSSSDSVFTSSPKAWRAEELERDLLSSSAKETISNWPQVPQFTSASHQSLSKSPSPRFSTLNHNQNKINRERMLTREEVERHMHSDSRVCFPSKLAGYVPSPFPSPLLRPNILSPVGPTGGNNMSGSIQSSPVIPLRPGRGPLLGGNCPVPDRTFMPFPYGVNARMNSMMHNQLPLRGPALPNLPPGFNPANLNINQAKLHNLPTRTISHPLMHKQFQFPIMVHNKCFDSEHLKNFQNVEDEYAGLMTQREKEWLIRIQLLLLKFENPYIEDYYFTTQVARRCRKRYSENALKGGGDAPEVILPETSKHENKTYVPTQYEGSLGKLQAVSVNFPRKVLDITVARPLEDDEGRVVTNQSLQKYRRLLLDIEKLYSSFLEIEDEQRRILAKPDKEDVPHRENISCLIKKIYSGLFCDSSDESFQNIMTIRKGRNLLMRAFTLFNWEQQLQCLIFLFRHISLILKKDQNDLVLVHNCEMIIDFIQKCSLSDLVQLGEALMNGSSSDLPSASGKEKNNFVAALKNKFGSSVICSMLLQAEKLYSGYELFETDVQTRWEKVVLHFVDTLCGLVNSVISPPVTPCSNLLTHILRFAFDRDKLDMLKEKLAVFHNDSKSDSDINPSV